MGLECFRSYGLRLERTVKDDGLMVSQDMLSKYFDSWNGEPATALFQRAKIRYQKVINIGRRIGAVCTECRAQYCMEEEEGG